MTVSPAHVRGHAHGRLTRWSLELATVSVAVLGVLALLSVWDVRDTDWGSWFVPIALACFFAAGIGAGAAAVVAIVKGERSGLLAVPVVVGALSAFVLVGEAFIWE